MKKLTPIFLFLFSFVFFGCQNFLSANAEAREKLQAEVKYAKANDIKVNLYAEDSSKVTIISTVTDAKQGYPFQVRYRIDSEKYFMNGWKLRSENRDLVYGRDYSFSETENNVCEITILGGFSSVELSPDVVSQPKLYFEKPKLNDIDSGNAVGYALCNNVALVEGSLSIGKRYSISYSLEEGKGYSIAQVVYEQNGVTLSQDKIDEYFDIETINAGLRNITVKTIAADGVRIKAKATDVAGIVDLSGPKITNGTISGMTKVIFSGSKSESEYPSVNAKNKISLALTTQNNDATKYLVIERCMKLRKNMVVGKNNGDWWDTDVDGEVQLFSDAMNFIGDSNFMKEDYYKETEVTSLSQIGVSVKKGGIHQWQVYAKNASGAMSPDPFVFAAKVETDAQDIVLADGTFTARANGFKFKYSITNIETYNQTLLNSLRLYSSMKIEGQSLNGVSANSISNDSTIEVSSGSNAAVKLKSNPPRAKPYEYRICVLDEYGNKGKIKEGVSFTNRVDVKEIAMGYVYNNATWFVSYMPVDEYLDYKNSGKTDLKPLGVVFHYDEAKKEVIIIASEHVKDSEVDALVTYGTSQVTTLTSNYKGTHSFLFGASSGREICETMAKSGYINNFPLFKKFDGYSSGLKSGINWYIPTSKEFDEIKGHYVDVNGYYSKNNFKSFLSSVNKTLDDAGMEKLKLTNSDYDLDYWCSNLSYGNKVKMYFMDGTNSSVYGYNYDDNTTTHYVRAFANLYEYAVMN